MQSIGSTFRRAGLAVSVSRQTTPVASSHVVTWNARRHASSWTPLSWVRDNLSLNTRERHSEKEIAAARKEQAEKGEGSVFDVIKTAESSEAEASEGVSGVIAKSKKVHTQHKYSTANFKISHRKLNMLGRQIAGKPIDSAVLQMMFSEKRASTRIKSMLVVAKDHAKAKGLEEKKLIVAEAWVSKGPNVLKRLEPKGRGRMGVRQHPDSRLHVILKEGKTRAALAEAERQRKLKRIISAGLTREDVPLRNPGPAWAW